MVLERSSPRNCKMTFIIGRGFAECQILKKWKWPYLFNRVEYFDTPLRKHWYWQDLAQEIENWHFLSVEALPSSKFWKSENGPISWSVRNIVINFAYTLILTRCNQWDCQMTFGIGRGFAAVQIWKKWNWSYLMNVLVFFNKKKCIPITIDMSKTERLPNLAQEIAKWHLTSVEAVPSSIFWKSENGRTEWTIVMKLCIHIDIDMM